MNGKKEKIVAYWMAGVLFFVGVVCYAAFPVTPPEQPVRIMLESTAGNVLFDHKTHASQEGYGMECTACHHDIEQEGARPSPCGECHAPDSEDMVKRSDALHGQCIGCHDRGGLGPVQCSGCHVL
ncbi:MAG: cytochrome c3 family protein [Deltaproteobacteria bacterium]|nr:cytochrome c3 family protein [Deltaproteobacteria bacterium]